jgi:protein-tyrosine-phosphatase
LKLRAAGLQEAAGKEAEEGAVIALQGVGIDISSHRSRFIGDLDLSKFDSVYCMDPGVMPIVHENLALQGVSIPVVLVNGPDGVPNPYGKDQAAYQLALEVTQREIGRAMSEDFFPML